ncbi:hypothetical protein RB653_004013 [Dictyostelium firmibasis]|uniref:EGF-like domain-containing protein n=1 Tax=Dictyostelium firmibasis TaxID=79012 RepID=A0AAN7U5I1_9MYCE
MKFQKIFIFIMILLFSRTKSISVEEYNCMNSIINLLGLGVFTNSYTNSTGQIQYCTTSFATCDVNESITQLLLNQFFTTNIIGTNSFTCFPNLNSISISQTALTLDFLYTLPTTVKFLKVDGCSGVTNITAKLPSYDSLIVISDSSDTFTVYLSWIQNIQFFQFTNNKYYKMINSTFITDFENIQNYTTLQSLSFSTNIIPDLTGFSCSIEMTLGNSFQSSSLDNLSTFTGSKELKFWYNNNLKSIDLPLQLLQLSTLKNLEININFKIPSSQYDFSNLTALTILQLMDLSSNGNNLGKNGLPISKLPPNLNGFYYAGILKKSPTMDIFKNIQTVDFSLCEMNDTLKEVYPPTNYGTNNLYFQNNTLYGTIPQSYCNFITDFSSNTLSGDIPNCFTCYFNDTVSNVKNKFSNNNFSNYETQGPCTSMKPKLIVDGTTLILYGESLGFNGKLIKTNATGSSTFTMIQPSSYFTLNLRTTNVYAKGARALVLTWTVGSEIRRFTLPIVTQAPVPANVTYSGTLLNQVEINGEFFTYNITDVSVLVSGIDCIVTSTTFNQIKCTLMKGLNESIVLPSEFVFVDIIVGSNKTSVYIRIQDTSYTNKIKCNPELCSSNTYCNLNDGICYPYLECPSDCELNDAFCNHGNGMCECKNNCSNAGTCNGSNGICSCNSDRLFKDCSGIQCPGTPVCSNHGTCDTSIGKCKCESIVWVGNACQDTQHYVNAITPSNENGGKVLLFGWFGSTHLNSSVIIGSQECIITSINQTVIECDIGSGKGVVSTFVYQNSMKWSSQTMYKYQSIQLKCPNDCTSSLNGNCDTTKGVCLCIGNFTGIDCGSYPTSNPSDGNNGPKTNTTVDDNTGSGSINNGDVDYQVSITTLLELGFDGSVINRYNLSGLWEKPNNLSNTNSNTHTFTQTIGKNCTITSTIEEVSKDKDYSFAGIDFKVSGGSLKLSIRILNYPYSSALNTLQLQMKSSTLNYSTSKCAITSEDQKVSVDSNGFTNQNDNLNYLTITKNNRKLYGRFLSKMMSDGRSTFTTSNIVSITDIDVNVALNLPHCDDCLLDPDFSILLNSNTKDNVETCDDESDKKISTTTIIAICVSVGGAAILGAAGYLIYRKNFVEVLPSTISDSKLRKMNKK